MTGRAAAACWLTGGVVYLSLEAVAARAVPGYRYAQDYISDLGRPSSPMCHLMNGAFATQGLLFLAGAVLLTRGSSRKTLPLLIGAAANAVGNLVVASVPSGSAGIAWVHVSGAVLAIVGGNAAILAGWRLVRDAGAPRLYPAVAVALAVLGLVSFVLLAVATTTSAVIVVPEAVWERASVYTIIAWQVFSSIVLLARPRTVDR